MITKARMFSLIKKDDIKTKPTAPSARTCTHYQYFYHKKRVKEPAKTITSNRGKMYEAKGIKYYNCAHEN